MAFRLYTSNRLELLAEALVQNLRKPLSSPFAEELIVVQSKGMERWLSLQIANRLGICANMRFPFPNAFVNFLCEKLQIANLKKTEPGERSVYEPKVLTWKIMKLLPALLDKPAFEPLRRYLTEPESELKYLQLAIRIADLFDQYLLYRPEMMFAWQNGQESHWQALLWREITQGQENLHRAALGAELIKILNRPGDLENLPQRTSVFGISALPEFHLQVLNALANRSEVSLFLMNPCQEYWGDIVSDSDIRRVVKSKKSPPETLDLFHFDKGNSLLASMGKLGRDFFDLLEEKFDCTSEEQFADPGQDSLLTCIQSDILKLEDRSISHDPKQRIAESDVSLQVHSCHSPRREIEVLQNYLLSLFESHPNLEPGDILVMTPDIEPYAPFIESIFDLPHADPRRIPFSISDRSYGSENEVVQTFLAILDLQPGRLGASEVLKILEAPSVRQRFDLTEDDLELIYTWVDETRIRWGKDAEHRRQLGLPEVSENSWRWGLDRLLLGYALPSDRKKLYRDQILPYDNIEGSQVDIFNGFLQFADCLFAALENFNRPKTLQEWREQLNDLLDSFFDPGDGYSAEIQVIRRVLSELDAFQKLSEFTKPVGLPVIRHYLDSVLRQEGHGYGFLTGGITFCSLLPMRSIPAKIICLLGMNNDTYPRRSKEVGFDLMAQKPRRGDRSRRNDDRYLFLEAMLSAREKIYISYVGQSIKDNSPIPPSVLVSELIDYIEANFKIAKVDIRDQLITEHKLQAFSPEYFKGAEKLFSYSQENLEAARCLLSPRDEVMPFLSADKLPEADESFRTVDIEDLYRFFRNPARFLLIRRLDLYLEESVSPIEDKEAFSLRGLERYKVAEDLVSAAFKGADLQEFKRLKTASGQLPHAAIGDYEYRMLSEKVRNFVDKTQTHTGVKKLEPLAVDLRLNNFQLSGQIKEIYDCGVVLFRFARVRTKDQLRVWLNHLVYDQLKATSGDSQQPSLLMGLDKDDNWQCWRYRPVADSKAVLSKLLKIYWEGLYRPIRFFPDSAWEFAWNLHNYKSRPGTALYRARQTWFGSGYSRGESEDPYLQLCFGYDRDPLTEEFQELAKTILNPILQNHEQVA